MLDSISNDLMMKRLRAKKLTHFLLLLSGLILSYPKGIAIILVPYINSTAPSIGGPESISRALDDHTPEKSSAVKDFSFDTEVAAKMRMQDQELKRELDQIFSDEQEDDLSYESDVKAVTDTSRSAGLDLQAIVKLLRANTTDELILISVLKPMQEKKM